MRAIIPPSIRAFSQKDHNPMPTGPLAVLLSFCAALASTFAWKITDIDFASKMGAKHISTAYSIIAILLICAGAVFAFFRKSQSPSLLFNRIQHISWCTFLLLWVVELQYAISDMALGIFLLKVLGHVYSSLTLISFWIMYDPYDPSCRISKNGYTALLIVSYTGILTAGFAFNHLPLIGAASFLPLICSLSFCCWILGKMNSMISNFDTARMLRTVISEEQNAGSSNKQKKRFSRSTIFLISGSILLNCVAGSSEYSVIADFEQKIGAHGAAGPIQPIGHFLTLIGLGNLLALISSTIWYSIRVSPRGLLLLGIMVLLTGQLAGYLMQGSELTGPLAWINPSIAAAAGVLLIVEILYPIIVQSNMMNVLASLPATTQRQARAIIEPLAEALGLIASVIVVEPTPISITTTICMCCAVFAISGFLLLKQKRAEVRRIWNSSKIAQREPNIEINESKTHLRDVIAV